MKGSETKKGTHQQYQICMILRKCPSGCTEHYVKYVLNLLQTLHYVLHEIHNNIEVSFKILNSTTHFFKKTQYGFHRLHYFPQHNHRVFETLKQLFQRNRIFPFPLVIITIAIHLCLGATKKMEGKTQGTNTTEKLKARQKKIRAENEK